VAARRLGCDYAPALVGWTWRGGRSLPLFRGIVVCSENATTVTSALESGVVLPHVAHDSSSEEQVGCGQSPGGAALPQVPARQAALRGWQAVSTRILHFVSGAAGACPAASPDDAAGRRIAAILARLEQNLSGQAAQEALRARADAPWPLAVKLSMTTARACVF
jgi:hypothetical protein